MYTYRMIFSIAGILGGLHIRYSRLVSDYLMMYWYMALLDPGIPNELYRLQHPAFEKQEEIKKRKTRLCGLICPKGNRSLKI